MGQESDLANARWGTAIWLCVPLACVIACDAGDKPTTPNAPNGDASLACSADEVLHAGQCSPDDALLRPRVDVAVQGSLVVAGGWSRPWMLRHSVNVSLQLDLLAQPLDSAVAVSLLSPSRGAACLVGSLPFQHGSAGKITTAGKAGTAGKLDTAGKRDTGAKQQTHHLAANLTVPDACAPLVGAPDIAVVTLLDPARALYMPARDDHLPQLAALRGTANDPAQRLQAVRCAQGQAAVGHDNAVCAQIAVAQSAGIDLAMGALQLNSTVGMVEYAGPPLRPVAARAAQLIHEADGTVHAGLEVGEVIPADHAPTLADAPVVTAGLAIKTGGLAAAAGSENLAGGEVTLAIRPAAGDDRGWMAVQHQAVADSTGKVTRGDALPVTAAQIRNGVGLAVQVALPERVVERVTTGDWRDVKLFELRACLQTATAERGPDRDAKANNCQTAELLLLRVRKDSGLHAYPPSFDAVPSAYDYFELGKTTDHPIGDGSVLKARVFRGGYREVENGHVRLGAKTWANMVFFPGPLEIETSHVVEAGAFHDVAPVADDFVSGYLTILSAYTLDLPDYTVPENFKFALNATADTKGSPTKFGGTANLGPLVDALNFVAAQASSDGLKWCLFDVACIKPPMQMPVSLKLGLALVKSTTVPSCEVVPKLGCYLKQGAKLDHFWNTAKACADIAATLPADRNDPAYAKALRGLANKWSTPFYLGLYRPGNDYIPFNMLKVFFEKGWGKYGTPFASTTPTFWAQYDLTIEPENGACGLVADDASAKFFKPNWTEAPVNDQLKTKPYLADQAAHAHVGCEAKLQPVCEYPVDGSQIAYESSEIYLQQTGSITVDGNATYKYEPLDAGVISLNALKGNLSLSGFIMNVTWAATAGIRWVAAQNPDKKWRTKGSNFGDVKISGQIGKFTISGQGCIFMGLPPICIDLGLFTACTPQAGKWECLDLTLGGLADILPTSQAGIAFSVNFLPFDVLQQ